MVLEPFIHFIMIIALAIGSFTDLKVREVPDWLSFSIIFFGLGFRLIFSTVTNDYLIILSGLIGFGIFLGLGYLFFYAGQWGGGDSKLLMGLGAVIGFDFNFNLVPMLFIFFLNVIIIGAIYGFFWSFFLTLKSWKQFKVEFKKAWDRPTIQLLWKLLIIGSVGLIILSYFSVILFILALVIIILMFLLLYLLLFMKAVEKSSLYKRVDPAKLTEGDWIVKDIKVDGKYVCGPKDLGIDKKQIAKLIKFKKLGKIKKVLIKEGIPFVPSFFFAYIVTVILGNWFLFLF